MSARGGDAMLNLLCSHDQQTLRTARKFFLRARQKVTKPNGYDIPSNALPAVCAVLAAKQENDNGLDESTAQKCACVVPRAFRAYMSDVRNALGLEIEEEPKQKRLGKPTFPALAQIYGVSDDIVVGMQEAQQELQESRLCTHRMAQSGLSVCVIFYWACKVTGMDPDSLSSTKHTLWDDYHLIGVDWDATLINVKKACKKSESHLSQSVAAMNKHSPSKKSAKRSGPAFDLLHGSTSAKDRILDKSALTAQTTGTHPTPITTSSSPTRSPLKRKTEVRETAEESTPRKRPFAPGSLTPSTSRTSISQDDENNSAEEEPSKIVQNLSAKPLASTPRKSALKQSKYLPSPSVTPQRTISPSKTFTSTKTFVSSIAAQTPNKSPSKSSRRVTRSGRLMGSYHEDEDADAELDSDEEEAARADPTKNLFTRVITDSDATDQENSEDDRAPVALGRRRLLQTAAAYGPMLLLLQRKGAAKLKSPAELLMRGGNRVQLVFKDRQAMFEVDPIIANKLHRFRQAQAKAAQTQQPETLSSTLATRGRKRKVVG
ncbi:hypothetical protein BKA62DRAFT_686295 [Auriculariales sp. MPI-PUGE-AT-0066]|nr:hypothetical protein BKA62DRAFT_686295 [Auriculariales sp. MPI-PUGE-AT-0066]